MPKQIMGWLRFVVFLSIVCTTVLSFQNCAPRGTGEIPTANSETGLTQKGDRILGLDISDQTGTGNFNDNLSLAASVGTQAVSLHVNWDQMEPLGNENTSYSSNFNYTDPGSILAIANSVYSTNKLKIALSVRPIYINQFLVPPSLRSNAFADPQMLMASRYFLMIKWLLTQKLTNVALVSLQIGTEMDGCIGQPSGCVDSATVAHQVSWSDYSQFLIYIKALVQGDLAIQALHLGLKIGMTTQYSGLVSDAASLTKPIKALNTNGSVDVVGVTYYPLNSDFTIKSPSVIKDELDVLLGIYPSGLPIYIMETGLPSSSLNNSSESIQAEYVNNIFKAWDSQNARIPFLCFTRLNDWTNSNSSECQGNAICGAFIQSLGFRTFVSGSIGVNKPAYTTLVTETQKRGWH